METKTPPHWTRRKPTNEERLLAREAARVCQTLAGFFCEVAANEAQITERMSEWMRDLAELEPFKK